MDASFRWRLHCKINPLNYFSFGSFRSHNKSIHHKNTRWKFSNQKAPKSLGKFYWEINYFIYKSSFKLEREFIEVKVPCILKYCPKFYMLTRNVSPKSKKSAQLSNIDWFDLKTINNSSIPTQSLDGMEIIFCLCKTAKKSWWKICTPE